MERLKTIHEYQKQEIIDLCANQEEELKQVKKVQDDKFDVFEEEFFNNFEKKKKILEGFQRHNELANTKGATKNIQDIEEEMKICEKEDEQNLMDEKTLRRFRFDNANISLFIATQGPKTLWMPSKVQYRKFNQLIARKPKKPIMRKPRTKRD